MSRQTSIKAFLIGESNTESEQAMSVDNDPLISSDDSQSDLGSDVNTLWWCSAASGYEPENESECTVTACASDIEEELLLQPNQPKLNTKKFGKNKVEYWSFNSKWFDNEKWLHWDGGTNAEISTC